MQAEHCVRKLGDRGQEVQGRLVIIMIKTLTWQDLEVAIQCEAWNVTLSLQAFEGVHWHRIHLPKAANLHYHKRQQFMDPEKSYVEPWGGAVCPSLAVLVLVCADLAG